MIHTSRIKCESDDKMMTTINTDHLDQPPKHLPHPEMARLSKRPQQIPSVLTWMGNKRRWASHLMNYVPTSVTDFFEPCAGAMHMSMRCLIDREIRIHGNDLNPDLINFWDCYVNNRKGLCVEIVAKYGELGCANSWKDRRELIKKWRRDYIDKTGLEAASRFYIWNRTAWSGNEKRGHASRCLPERWLKRAKEGSHLANIPSETLKGSTFTCGDILDYLKSIESKVASGILKKEEAFIFIDPPYIQFEHDYRPRIASYETLAQVLLNMSHLYWVVCDDIKNLEVFRKLFPGCVIGKFPVWYTPKRKKGQAKAEVIRTFNIVAMSESLSSLVDLNVIHVI